MAAAMVDYYAELGLDRAATKEQLEAELKALRKKWISRQNAADTDKRQKAERMVAMIREATEILLDADKRKKYEKDLDKRGAAPVSMPQQEEQVPMSSANLQGAELLDAMETYYDASKYTLAIAAANQALASGMIEVDVYRYLILSYVEKGDLNNAVRAINNMYAALPEDPDGHLLAAKIYLRVLNGREREARTYLDLLFAAGYGDATEVAALDVEYYVDTGDMALAEQKVAEYLAAHPNDSDFKASVANAYTQYAEANYTTEIGGDWYIDSEENFKQYDKLVQKALSIMPNSKLLELSKVLKKRQMVPGSWMSWGSCLLYAVAGFGAEAPLLGVLSLLIGAALFYFSLVPNWMVERFEYHGHLCGLYEVVRYIGMAVSFVWRVSWAIFTFIWRLIWSFI